MFIILWQLINKYLCLKIITFNNVIGFSAIKKYVNYNYRDWS